MAIPETTTDQLGPSDFRAVFELVAAPVLILDRNLAIVTVNQAWLDATGVTAASVIGTNLFDTFPETDERQSIIRSALDDAFAGTATTLEALPYAIPTTSTGSSADTAPSGGNEPLVLRYWDMRLEPIVRDNGPVQYVVQTTCDVTNVVMANQLQRAHDQRLRMILDVSELGTWELDVATMQARCDLRHDQILGYDQKVEPWSFEVFSTHVHAQDLALVTAALEQSVQGQDDWDFECRITDAKGCEKWIEVCSRYRQSPYEKPGFIGTIEDITDRKADELRMQIISEELDHRVKNILATVVSVARIAGRRATAVDTFVADFSDRMSALARTHSALAANQWNGLSIGEIIEAELAPYTGTHAITISAPDEAIRLKPKAAQAIGMAVHELATNAAKYGALSQPAAALSVAWTIGEPGSVGGAPDSDTIERTLNIVWRETGVENLQPPNENGFGSTMISQVMVAQFNADVDFRFEADGLVYTFAIPLNRVVGADPARPATPRRTS